MHDLCYTVRKESTPMLCPECSNKTEVDATRKHESRANVLRRRRRCVNCGYRFTTYEIPAAEWERWQAAEKTLEEIAELTRQVMEG